MSYIYFGSEKEWGQTGEYGDWYNTMTSINAYGETRFYEDDSGVIDNTKEQFRANINLSRKSKFFNVTHVLTHDPSSIYSYDEIPMSFGGTDEFKVSAANFNEDYKLWRFNRVNCNGDGDNGCGLVVRDESYSLVGKWGDVDWLSLVPTGTGEDLYLEIVSGASTTSSNYTIGSVNSSVEVSGLVLPDGSLSNTKEQIRTRMNVIRAKNWFNINGLTIPANSMHITENISGWFNGNSNTSVEKHKKFGNFFLISQTIQPKEQDGSLMITSSEDWCCVGPWIEAPW